MTAYQYELPLARRSDPVTSHLAGQSVDTRRGRHIVLTALRRLGPCTDDMLYTDPTVCTSLSPSGARTRRSELVHDGEVEDTGERVKTASGRKAIVWRAVEHHPMSAHRAYPKDHPLRGLAR